MSSVTSGIPQLKNGDRLTKEEFLRRWEASPEIRHAELLEGIVYVNSDAISLRNHGRPQNIISAWLDEYERYTPGVFVASPSTIELSDNDLPEPDAMMYIDHPVHGSTRVEGDWLIGPAELVVEIAASTANRDLRVKKSVYERAGVKECLIWRTIEAGLDWFTLEGEQYKKMVVDPADGLYKSTIYPGLWLDPQALLAMDKKGVLDRMQPGLYTPEHTAFVEMLKS